MKKKIVIFDLDGTLLDTLEDIRHAINCALSSYQIPLINEDETKSFVGRGLRNALIKAVQKSKIQFNDNDISCMNEILVASYLENPSKYARPYEGILELLNWLQDCGIKIAIASNKKDEIVQKIIKNIFPTYKFAFAFGQKSEYPLKPNPTGILRELEKLNIDVSDILYIGDSEVDYETAKNLKCDYFIVNYGFRSKEELESNGIYNTISLPLELKEKIETIYS